MSEGNINQEFRLKNIDKTRNYFVNKIESELMIQKHRKVCTTLNYIEHLLILASAVIRCISISSFCFFTWYCYRKCEFCNWIKNACNNCRICINV